ncbi:MAG: CocE/NonD family hydrolase [Chloroflexi bacterium]|nr:CocE/NonD family hydrolase [Chloroflexota bacterium]
MTKHDKQYPNAAPLKVVVESNMELTTRDGVVLRADVYHPVDAFKYPALVCRTPYQKLTPRYVETAINLAARGYCVVMQDFRGRYASDGDYEWMWRERTETHDTPWLRHHRMGCKARMERWTCRHMGTLERQLGNLDDARFTAAESNLSSRQWHVSEYPRH